MAEWRKVIVSGSNAELNTLFVETGLAIDNNQIISGSEAVLTGSFTGSFSGDGSGLTGLGTDLAITGSDGSTDNIALLTEALTIAGDNGVTATIASNTLTIGIPEGIASSSAQVKEYLPAGTVSASSQVVASQVTGIGQYAQLTGSNTFTAVNTFSNTTNSTTFSDGAVVIAGGLGVGKDVNISGSLNVTGLLTAISMSTQYVTSSQYTIGTSRVIVNDDDLIRFAGLSVRDSGSTPYTGSLLWDSQRNHWLYENESGSAYNSALLIAGPKNTGSLGDEVGLIAGRIPVATGEDHIDTNPSLTPLRVDGGDFHVEADTYVTGAVSSSVGFAGDGSALTGIVTTLSVTGSNGSNSSVDLKTQGLSFANGEGIVTSVAGQTVTITGEDASTSNKGLASFSNSYFTVAAGAVSVSASAITETELNTSVAGTGLSGGGGSPLSVDYGSSAGTAVEGDTTLNFIGTANEVNITSGSTITLGSGGTVQIGLPDSVSITSDLTVGGNLTVNGTVTTIDTTNLVVEDKFILLSSGSAAGGDGGIIIDQGSGAGQALFYDGSGGRWAFEDALSSTATSGDPDAYLATVVDIDGGQSATNYEKVGNIKVESGEIYIWA